MNSEQIKQIDQWLDGTLSPQDEVTFTEHLRQDVEMQRALVRAAHLRRALRQAVSDRITRGDLGLQPNSPNSSRPSGRLPARPQQTAGTRWFAPLLWVAAATLLVVIGVGRWNHHTVGLRLAVGDSKVSVDGHPPAAPIVRDILVTTGSRVEVIEGTASLRTEDGSVIVLSSGSRVVIGDGKKQVLDLEAGTASATVTKQQPGQNFVITAPRLNARVVGTAFTLWALDDRTGLNVLEGVVAASTGDGSEQRVRAGERIILSDELLGWRFQSGGDDVVRLRADHDLRHEGHPTLEVRFIPPKGTSGWDLVQRPFRIAGQKSVRLWIYIDATDERAEVSVHAVEEGGESWLLSTDRLRGKPLHTWIPIDVPLQNPIKRIWREDDNYYDFSKVEFLRVVPRLGSMQLHIDISSSEHSGAGHP